MKNKIFGVYPSCDHINNIPQPKIGHWIKNKGYDDRDNYFTCSECGRTINIICGETLADYPYCHCGAKMQEEEE